MSVPVNVPALWLIASIAANVILLLLFAVFALSRGDSPAAAGVGGESWETRIERLDVLWYPSIQFSSSSKKVLKTVPGVPHCKECVVPLVLKEGTGWSCPMCGNHFSESLVDVSILDVVGKQALKYFLERHKDFRPS